MKKKLMVSFFIMLSCLLLYSQTSSDKEEFMSEIFKSFHDSIDVLVNDYSAICGFYTTSGQLEGAASIGSFPSFRIGMTTGVIFMTNPIRFLKEINFSNNSWNTIRKEKEFKDFKPYFSWFDSYFLPLPLTRINFDVGLPKGFSVGGHFHVMPVGSVLFSLSEPEINSATILAGGGLNFTYTFLKEYRNLPSVSTGFETAFSYVGIDVRNIPVGTIYLDSSNPDVPAKLGFLTKNYTVSFAVDFSISKRIRFFQPFVNLKFVQSVYYNETSFLVSLDTSEATSSAQELYDTDFSISNTRNVDYFNNRYGDVRAVTDFVFSAGFEFVIKTFRIGLECSFSTATQKVMTTAGIRVQLEKTNLKRKTRGPQESGGSGDDSRSGQEEGETAMSEEAETGSEGEEETSVSGENIE